MQYVPFNDKTFMFRSINDGYISIKLRQLISLYKDKTYNGLNSMGEGLQWGKVCNGFSVPLQIFRGEGLQWGEGLQYNTGANSQFPLRQRMKILVHDSLWIGSLSITD